MTKAGSNKARLVAVAFEVAREVNVDLVAQDLVKHCHLESIYM